MAEHREDPAPTEERAEIITQNGYHVPPVSPERVPLRVMQVYRRRRVTVRRDFPAPLAGAANEGPRPVNPPITLEEELAITRLERDGERERRMEIQGFYNALRNRMVSERRARRNSQDRTIGHLNSARRLLHISQNYDESTESSEQEEDPEEDPTDNVVDPDEVPGI